MDPTEATPAADGADPIIVKADEVDEAGADISTIPDAATDREFTAQIESRRVQDAQAVSSPKILANAAPDRQKPLARPILRREGSAPPPPQQPPPPSPQQSEEETGNSTDSLSLLQLRRLVTDLPRLEPTAYAFTYSDTQAFPEELEEWFQYTEEDRYLLTRAKITFDAEWKAFGAANPSSPSEQSSWIEVGELNREAFVGNILQDLDLPDSLRRVASVECLAYVALGVWGDTAGLPSENDNLCSEGVSTEQFHDTYERSALQIEWIRKDAELLQKLGALGILFDLMRRICDYERTETQSSSKVEANGEASGFQSYDHQQEMNNILTLLYVLVEVGRWQIKDGQIPSIRQAIADLQPNFLLFLTRFVANLRWEDYTNVPLTRVLLLYWKSVLLLFGGTEELNESKADLRDESDPIDEDSGEGFITASPLDYHLFRQEITSKYPAYNPPPPLVALELENNSILPPLPNHPSRSASFDGLYIGVGNNGNGVGQSIINKPVHIATPAPSPPPSPAGPGGKGGKKQNYQTNQNFPFLYPPLDETSNSIGGKGSAVLQSELAKTKWEGSDIPASISEAGQLFANRMRMTRSLRQLWDEREKFMKFERGWDGPTKDTETLDEMPDDLSLDESSEEGPLADPEEEVGVNKETDDEEVQRRLDAVEDFYRQAMPQLQSVVIVLLKVILANVTAIVTQNNGQNGLQNGFSFPENGGDAIIGKPKSNLNLAQQLNGAPKGPNGHIDDNADPGLEELNAVRLREITAKAISGILIMLLKWFKLSHILKYEYLTQLLLDSNYLPLVLKLFAHQDVDRSIDQNNDKEDLNFFYFCQTHSKHRPPEPLARPPSSSSSSSDDAQPPPILKHRRSPTSQSPALPPSPPPPNLPPRPEVDELGYPTAGPLPTTLLTSYSACNFFTSITLLRILQKITKRKAHRALLLVQYKSSTILRKALKIPQPELRLYTLKLFKSQVRYCGRKWRQSNMRVITAIYLHCRPELRDEWLSGSDVDAEVEEALPLEQAVRGLVHWWHLRCYPEVMGEEVGRDSEGDFFAKELERMGWGVGVGFTGEEGEEGVVEDVGGGGGSEWDGAPLQMEGW